MSVKVSVELRQQDSADAIVIVSESFLESFADATREASARAVAQALGATKASCEHAWEEGEVDMPKDEVDLHATTDPMVWATEFVRIVRDLNIDVAGDDAEGFMVAWFSNLLGAERDARRSATVGGSGPSDVS